MAAVDEIAIKLGVDVTQFKAALADANASVKTFKKSGEGDFFGGLKQAKKSFNDIKDVIVAGGVATAVVNFFQLAIEGANKSTDATNKNAAAVREFGKGIEEVKGVASNVAVATVGFFNRIGSSIGDTINELKAFAAGGIEGAVQQQRIAKLVEETAKAADQAERNLAESRKKHGAEFLAITKELADIEKKSQEQKLKGLSSIEQEAQLRHKMQELVSKSASVENDAIERRRLALQIAQTQLALDDASLAVKKEIKAVEEKIAEEDKRHAAALAKTSGDEERIAKLRLDVTKAEAALRAAFGNSLKTEEAILDVKKAQNALSEEEAKIQAEARKARALDADLENELFRLRKKSADEGTASERERITVTSLQNEQLLVQRGIRELLAKEAKQGLSLEETFTLNTLKDQSKVIDEMIAKRKAVSAITLNDADATTKLTVSEKNRLDVLELQKKAQEEQAEIKRLQAKLVAETITPAERDQLVVLQGQITQTQLLLETKQKVSLGQKEDLELFTLQSKNAAALTDAERARLAELKAQSEEKIRQNEIAILYKKLMDETITPAEEKQLATLIKQSEQYERQVQTKLDLAKVTNTQQAQAEEKISGNYADQISMIGDQITAKDELIFKAAGVQLNGEKTITAELKEQLRLAQEREGIKVKVTNTGDISNLSQIQLEALIENLNKQIASLKAFDPFARPSPELLILQSGIAAALDELKKRNEFIQTIKVFGSQVAERNFSPAEFQRLSQLFNPDIQKQQAQDTRTLVNGLARVFPDAFTNAR